MIMKNYVAPMLLLLAIALSATTVQAQKKQMGTPEERAGKLTSWMTNNLQLNETQAAQVQEINLRYANKNQALLTSPSSKREKAQTLKADDEAKDEELKKVLTDEQFKTYQTKKNELKKQMKAKAKEKRKGMS